MVTGNKLVLTYDETLAAATPAKSAYTVEAQPSGGSFAGVTVSTATVDATAKTVTLALASAVGVGDTVRVSYVKPSTNKLTDAIGNEAAALSNQAVTNSSARPTLDITGPSAKTKDAFTVTLTFNAVMTGFAVGDVAVTNGTKGTLTETTTGKVWTLGITPSSGIEGNVTVAVAQGAATHKR